MFKAVFEEFAGRPCLKDGERSLSYAEVLAIGERLTSSIPKQRTLIVLQMSLTVEAIATYVALSNRDHVLILLESDLSPVLSQHIFDIYDPAIVLDPGAGACAVRHAQPFAGHPDLALLLTTSGSTGSPKLVRLTQAGLQANARSIGSYLALGEGDCALLHLPASYSYGLSIINSHLLAGACIGLTRHSVVEAGYYEDLERYAATSISGVPFHYAALRRFGMDRLAATGLRTLTQAGGRLDPRLATWFANWAAENGREFFVMYGQTEAGPRITYVPPGRLAAAPDAIGVPIDGVTIDLVDEDGTVVGDGPGEMRVTSPATMLGYANCASDLARGDDLGGVLHTGDIAIRGEDGLLRIVGRRSRMLKMYGLRINLDEIERRCSELGHSVICFGEDDSLRVLTEGGEDPAIIRQSLIELYSLPPRSIDVRRATTVKRSATGKLTAALLNEAWAGADA